MYICSMKTESNKQQMFLSQCCVTARIETITDMNFLTRYENEVVKIEY